MARTLATILFEQGRYAEAEKLSRAALDIFERSGTLPGSYKKAQVRQSLVAVLVAGENWKGAMDEIALARADLGGSKQAVN